MRETSKAYKLLKDDPLFQQIPKGQWIDVGAGDDCLAGASPFDKAHGDAHTLEGIPANSLNLVFSSHCIEHLEKPLEAVNRWFDVLRPGGWLWIIAPDFQLYEHEQWPSLFNEDHKQRFTIGKGRNELKEWDKEVWYLEDFAKYFVTAEVKRIAFRKTGYDMSKLDILEDQTTGNAEASCELVMRKL